MKLLTAGPSPFANKVLMAAKLIGLPLEAVNTDAHGQSAELIDANPLGKIPCLVLDDGRTLFDSRPITQYLDRVNGGGLYPSDADALFDVSRYEALCDGICDCAVAFQYEMRMRPEEKWHQPWLDRQWTKVKQGLSEATKELPALDSPLDIRAIGLGATIGYLQLRFPGQWEEGNEALVDWMGQFEATYPDVAALKPRA